MKLFHISDVLTVTTGRLVSSRHVEGIYDILNFLTGDNLFTHQLPRAMRECEPWLRTQFPRMFPDNPLMKGLIEGMDQSIAQFQSGEYKPGGGLEGIISRWVESVRQALGVPEHLPVYEMGVDMHLHIDPIEELEAMVGKDKVIAVEISEER